MPRRVAAPASGADLRHRKTALLSPAVAALAVAGVLATMAGCTSPRSALLPGQRRVSAAHGSTGVSGARIRPTAHGSAAVGRAQIQSIAPAMFSPGACVAFAPTQGNRDQTVFLDAGHGGVDPGGTGTTEAGAVIGEAQVDLHVELATAALLRSRGYRVVVSRTRQTTVIRLTKAMTSGALLTATGVRADVAARDRCADMARASILIGIYMNAFPGGAGCLTMYDASRPFSADNRMLATMLQGDVLAAMNARGWGIPDGGVRPDTGMGSAVTAADQAYGHLILLGPAKAGYFSTPSRMPGALIEPLFVTDPFEASLAASARGQHVIAVGIVNAVGQYFASIGKRVLSSARHSVEPGRRQAR